MPVTTLESNLRNPPRQLRSRSASAREEAHQAMPDGSDQFGGVRRRSAGELGADTAAGGADDFRALERGAYDEYGLPDNSRLRR